MGFQQIYNRKGTNSVKWDNLSTVFKKEDVLPLWIADMDFKAPNAVNEAIIERARHGIYGYTMVNEHTKNIVQNWLQKRHQWKIDHQWLTFSPNVIMGIHTAIQTLTKKDDKILIQTPVYTPFFNLINNGDRKIVENPLLYKNGTYSIDYDLFEKQLQQGVKAFIMCSPHNPVGRVWSRSELMKIGELCVKYNVFIFSDEIHADLVFKDNKHIPIASLSDDIAEKTITFMSPTKTFNLAGLQASFIISRDKGKQLKIQNSLANAGAGMLNTMGQIAMEVAYQHGEQWLSELLEVISKNKLLVEQTIDKEIKEKISIVASEGTYLLWLDCRNLNMNDDQLQQFMVEKAKVGLNRGIAYGKDGSQFMRMNIACPTNIVKKAMSQIVSAIHQM